MESFSKAKFWSLLNHLHVWLDCAHYMHTGTDNFIVPNRFTTINCWSEVHYDISLQRTSLQRYIVVIYCFALRDIVAMKSCWNDISVRYREDCTDISLIYRFHVRRSVQCFADISAINRKNKARYSSIIVCITLHSTVAWSCTQPFNLIMLSFQMSFIVRAIAWIYMKMPGCITWHRGLHCTCTCT